MKKLFRALFLIVFLQMSFGVFAQKMKITDVPEDVRQSLEFEYPSGKVSSWNMENNAYVATFKEEGATGKAYFDKEGQWLKSTFMIPKNELPTAVKDYINQNYKNSTIITSMLQSIQGERMHYYIEVKQEALGSPMVVLTFTDLGELMNKIEQDKDGNEIVAAPVAEKEKAEKNNAKPTAQGTSSAPAKANASNTKKEKKEKIDTDEFGNVVLPPSDIPELVSKELLKKVQRPEELKWYKIDSFYVAKCLNREQKNEVFISTSGKWDKTYIHLPESAVSGNMAKHLNSFYNGWRFKQAIKEVRADKNDKVLVDLYEKNNWKEKLVTTVIFDKAGKMITTIDPTRAEASDDSGEDASLERYYEKMSMAVEVDPNAGIPSQVVNTFKGKYPRITNPEWSEDEDGNYQAAYMGTKGKEVAVIGESGTLLQTQTIGRLELLPSAIQTYIKQNKKGYKADEFYAVKDLLEKKNLYKVYISNKKTKQNEILWFTLNGKIVN